MPLFNTYLSIFYKLHKHILCPYLIILWWTLLSKKKKNIKNFKNKTLIIKSLMEDESRNKFATSLFFTMFCWQLSFNSFVYL